MARTFKPTQGTFKLTYDFALKLQAKIKSKDG